MPRVGHVDSGRSRFGEFFEVIPSYDGETIAIIERTVGANTGGPCPSGHASVTFVDATTLLIVSEYEWAVTDIIQSGWTEADEVIVHAPNDGAWRVTASTGPTPTDSPWCVYPRTSSGEVSGNGVVIGGGLSINDPITVFPPFPEGNPYGRPE